MACRIKSHFAVWLCLLVIFSSFAQAAPDLVKQAQDKKTHGDFKGAAAIYTNLGNARKDQGDLTGALAAYTQALSLDPHHVQALLNRGNVRSLKKQYESAITDYTAVIALDPKNAAAFYNRAGAERSLTHYSASLADYSNVIALNPSDVPAYLNRAVLRMAQKDWMGATSDLNKCLHLVPEDRQAYPRIYLWVVATRQGQSLKAGKELTGYLKHSPKTLEKTWGWQVALFLNGQLDEARFLALAPTFQSRKDRNQLAQAYYYAGLKRQAAGDPAGATKLFQQCVKAGTPSVHEFILARAELKASGGSRP